MIEIASVDKDCDTGGLVSIPYLIDRNSVVFRTFTYRFPSPPSVEFHARITGSIDRRRGETQNSYLWSYETGVFHPIHSRR